MLTKALVIFVVLWLVIAPFFAFRSRDPILFFNAPWLIVFGLMVVLSALTWILKRLGH